MCGVRGWLRLKAAKTGLEREEYGLTTFDLKEPPQTIVPIDLDDLDYIVADALYLVLLITIFLFRCLPGIFVACLGWLLTSWMTNKWPQVILRGLLVALAITPTAAGHAGLIPAVWNFFYSSLWFEGSYLLQRSTLPLLLVWSLAIPVIYAFTLSSGTRRRRLPWDQF